jgi:dolichol-phosphate mannosyltransferase
MTPPTDTSTIVEPAPIAAHHRVMIGLRKPANWLQLVQFGTVGASGFIVNTVVYVVLLRKVGLHYLPSSFCAFCVAVMNNFMWNRLWTFRHRKDASHAAFQAMRFLVVSSIAYGLNAAFLTLFVEQFGIGKVVAQLVAVTLVMPVSFLGNKLWSFR